jgi:hypothetical protein
MTTTVQQMTLQKRIMALPKVLQDSISMFNADHRQEMQPVFSELIDKYAERYFMCDNMDCYCDGEIFGRPIVTTILFQEYYFCCERCEGEGEDNIYRCYRKYKAQQRR